MAWLYDVFETVTMLDCPRVQTTISPSANETVYEAWS